MYARGRKPTRRQQPGPRLSTTRQEHAPHADAEFIHRVQLFEHAPPPVRDPRDGRRAQPQQQQRGPVRTNRNRSTVGNNAPQQQAMRTNNKWVAAAVVDVLFGGGSVNARNVAACTVCVMNQDISAQPSDIITMPASEGAVTFTRHDPDNNHRVHTASTRPSQLVQ